MPELFTEKEFYAIYGVVVGAIITLIGAWAGRRQGYRLKLWDKLIDKKIKAHESVICVALEMRKTCPLGGRNENNELRRIPYVLRSFEDFEIFLENFTVNSLTYSSWLTGYTRKEFNFTQDYLVNVHEYISKLSVEELRVLAENIHLDFIALSSELEKTAFEFYKKDVLKFNVSDLKKWHKYDINTTLKRLENTHLFKLYLNK